VVGDATRAAELSAYFTHCNLQPVHNLLSLQLAMTVFFKLKNYASCATFCRRLLELNPPAKVSSYSTDGS
jgi:coatomer subunit alpha